MGRTSFYESLHFVEKHLGTSPCMDDYGFSRILPKKYFLKKYGVKKSSLAAVFQGIRDYLRSF